jgi:ribosomal protein S18 acetylase RimI-like enzyme
MAGAEGVVVREPRPQDAEAIATAHVRAWQVGYRGAMPDAYLDTIDLDERIGRWHTWLVDGAFRTTTVRVAERTGAVVGFAIHGPQRDEGEPDGAQAGGPPASRTVGQLYALNVHPDHWSCGAGTALLTDAQTALVQAGFTEAVLWVLPENTRGRALYERHGWWPDGTAKADTVLGLTVPEVRYRRPLP